MPWAPACSRRDPRDVVAAARDEGDVGAAVEQVRATSARPSPEVPPVMATRRPSNGSG